MQPSSPPKSYQQRLAEGIHGDDAAPAAPAGDEEEGDEEEDVGMEGEGDLQDDEGRSEALVAVATLLAVELQASLARKKLVVMDRPNGSINRVAAGRGGGGGGLQVQVAEGGVEASEMEIGVMDACLHAGHRLLEVTKLDTGDDDSGFSDEERDRKSWPMHRRVGRSKKVDNAHRLVSTVVRGYQRWY